jgi:hypothetical protein
MRVMIGLLGATMAARWSPPSATPRREEAETALIEAEVAARHFDTTERRVELVWRSIFFGITVILIGITVYCCLEGRHTTVPFVTGPFGIATGIASFLQPRIKGGP